jgi:uncharacterized protein (UPF0332 family)
MEQPFLERAKENISAAEELFASQRYNASANRSYYAAFHAAIAALFHYGYEPEIDHKPVQSSFVRLLIHQRKVFPSSLKTDLLDLQNVRGEADYRSGIGKKRAAAQLKQAQIFVSTILNAIQP